MPTTRRFINIRTCTHNSVVYTTVQEISIDETIKEIEDSGDDDSEPSFLVQGTKRVSGTLTISDPVQGAALHAAAAADLTFLGQPGDSGATVATGAAAKETIKNFRSFGRAAKRMHDGKWADTIRFRGYSTDGGTTPTRSTVLV